MNLGELLKKEKVSHEFVAKKLCEKGCFKYRQQVTSWVTGVRLPDAESIYWLSKILKVSSDVVLEAALKSAGRL
ncbi:MAG: hypothetical protein J6K39_02880 [Clostridia bacterium]|nr:hypothetical protein [Clostridia bacterium]